MKKHKKIIITVLILAPFIFLIHLTQILWGYNLANSNNNYNQREEQIQKYYKKEIEKPLVENTKEKVDSEKAAITKPLDNNENQFKVSETKIDSDTKNKSFSLEQEIINENSKLYIEETTENQKVADLKIDNINLNLAILKGKNINEDNMMLGAITNKKYQELGKGNYVLSSHKSFGNQLFSNLYKLVVGDMIEISDSENTYYYRVYANFEITEDDTWILKDLENKEILTLYTCESTNETNVRTVVRAELIEIKAN